MRTFCAKRRDGASSCLIRLQTQARAKEDLRPAFLLEDVEGADFSHMKLPRGDAGKWTL
jgi:hypothetical protein